MAWVRLDDHIDEHPKVAMLGDSAFALYITAIVYCNRNLTDGFIPRMVGLGKLRYCSGDPLEVISEIVAAGLWEVVQGGWRIHDFLDYQPSRAQVERSRYANRNRKPASSQTDDERATDGLHAEYTCNTDVIQTEYERNTDAPKPNPNPNPKPKPENDSGIAQQTGNRTAPARAPSIMHADDEPPEASRVLTAKLVAEGYTADEVAYAWVRAGEQGKPHPALAYLRAICSGERSRASPPAERTTHKTASQLLAEQRARNGAQP